MHLQIEFPLCHKQLDFQLGAACDRWGIESANIHFGKSQVFETPCTNTNRINIQTQIQFIIQTQI